MYMQNHTELLTHDNVEGIKRVFEGEEDYAFLMESKSIEYTTQRLCNLTKTGKELDDKNYGIGMRKGTFNVSKIKEKPETKLFKHGVCLSFHRV